MQYPLIKTLIKTVKYILFGMIFKVGVHHLIGYVYPHKTG